MLIASFFNRKDPQFMAKMFKIFLLALSFNGHLSDQQTCIKSDRRALSSCCLDIVMADWQPFFITRPWSPGLQLSFIRKRGGKKVRQNVAFFLAFIGRGNSCPCWEPPLKISRFDYHWVEDQTWCLLLVALSHFDWHEHGWLRFCMWIGTYRYCQIPIDTFVIHVFRIQNASLSRFMLVLHFGTPNVVCSTLVITVAVASNSTITSRTRKRTIGTWDQQEAIFKLVRRKQS